MTDDLYLQHRARTEQRLAEVATHPRAREAHEQLHQAYLQRAGASPAERAR